MEDRVHIFGVGDLGVATVEVIAAEAHVVAHAVDLGAQRGRGHAARAKAILDAYVEDGLGKGYVYRLMCELAVASGDVAACPGIRDLAYARPAYVEDALQSVNSYAAIAVKP